MLKRCVFSLGRGTHAWARSACVRRAAPKKRRTIFFSLPPAPHHPPSPHLSPDVSHAEASRIQVAHAPGSRRSPTETGARFSQEGPATRVWSTFLEQRVALNASAGCTIATSKTSATPQKSPLRPREGGRAPSITYAPVVFVSLAALFLLNSNCGAPCFLLLLLGQLYTLWALQQSFCLPRTAGKGVLFAKEIAQTRVPRRSRASGVAVTATTTTGFARSSVSDAPPFDQLQSSLDKHAQQQ